MQEPMWPVPKQFGLGWRLSGLNQGADVSPCQLVFISCAMCRYAMCAQGTCIQICLHVGALA